MNHEVIKVYHEVIKVYQEVIRVYQVVRERMLALRKHVNSKLETPSCGTHMDKKNRKLKKTW